MRFGTFVADIQKNRVEGDCKNLFERVLIISFITVFAIMLIAQAALANPNLWPSIAIGAQFEGKPLGIEEFLYDEAKIVIELLNNQSNPLLKVMVNGDEIAVFDRKTIEINVKAGDVIEIDGSEIQDKAEVKLMSESGNISEECLYKRIVLSPENTRELIRIKMKDNTKQQID